MAHRNESLILSQPEVVEAVGQIDEIWLTIAEDPESRAVKEVLDGLRVPYREFNAEMYDGESPYDTRAPSIEIISGDRHETLAGPDEINFFFLSALKRACASLIR
ncbi:MAG TPA: hypothetical protein VGA08_03450 [Candidatus Saccharimonadales bacterium]